MLVNIKELGLIGNKLTTIPKAINKLVKLEVLHAEENQMESLPKGLGKLESLKKIYLQVRRAPSRAPIVRSCCPGSGLIRSIACTAPSLHTG